MRMEISLSLAFFCLGICAALAFSPALRAAAPIAPSGSLQQSFTDDGIKTTVSIFGEQMPRFGFVPLRITVDNALPRELRWDVSFNNTWFSNTNSGAVQWRTAMAVPGSRASERWIFVPTADAGMMRAGNFFTGNENFSVAFAGTDIRDSTLRFNTSAATRRMNSMVPWAVSSSLEGAVRRTITALTVTGSTSSSPPPPGRRFPGRPPPPAGPRPLVAGTLNVTAFDPSQSLGDWRVWSPFTRVVMRADEFAGMPPANRAALRNWVALGGMLFLEPVKPGEWEEQPLGAGRIVSLHGPVESETRERLFNTSQLFGATAALPLSSELAMQKGGLTDKVSAARQVGDWLVYFFIGFAVLVGPVNLFAIAPAKRRHWLFLTVPGISLGAVGLLVAAIYVQDGVGGEGARRALVVLLPGESQASVFQEQVSRTGLLFGTGFPLADDTICAAISPEGASSPGRTLTYVRDQGHASGDWFRGRARQAQHLRRLTPTRARVELVGTAADGAPIVQSSASAVMREFCYVDPEGDVWGAATLAPGARTTLSRQNYAGTLSRHVTNFGNVVTMNLNSIAKTVLTMKTSRFVALADDSELAPIPTLNSIKWKDSAVLITGLVEGAGATGKGAP